VLQSEPPRLLAPYPDNSRLSSLVAQADVVSYVEEDEEKGRAVVVTMTRMPYPLIDFAINAHT